MKGLFQAVEYKYKRPHNCGAFMAPPQGLEPWTYGLIPLFAESISDFAKSGTALTT